MSSSKRAAGRELNHDNWNEEEASEDAGEFKKASEDELERRVRKVAKRRIVGDSENSTGTNPFSGFGGFKANTGLVASTPLTNPSPFSFLAKIPSAVTPKTNGTTEEKSSTHIEYLSKVKALNIAVSDWIKSHVDKDPLCILTPIFEDYGKHLKELEELRKKSTPKASLEKPKDSEPKTATTPPSNNFSFGKPSVPTSTVTSPQSSNVLNPTGSNSVFNNFKFGNEQQKTADSPQKTTSATAENKGITCELKPKPCFSFGLLNSTSCSPDFQFGGFSGPPKSFSFANTVQPSQSDPPKTSAEEDADEEPPKNDFVPVVEDDSLYSKRCKVFVKGASDFTDRGVGMLYIKKVQNSKIQLIVRADTNLGNILLNIMIVDGLPVTRSGKNNVMIVCIPTPDAKPPPTSVLIRVKTGEEADDLFNTINKYKT